MQTVKLSSKSSFSAVNRKRRVFYKGRWYEGLYLNVGASDDDKNQLKAFQKEIDFWVNWRDATGKTRVHFAGC